MTSVKDRLHSWFHTLTPTPPWEFETDPYRIWLFRTLLNQAEEGAASAVYCPFVDAFPTLARLAHSDPREVEGLWNPLGDTIAGLHFRQSARAIMTHHRATIPQSATALLTLVGIGPDDATAIASEFSTRKAVLRQMARRVAGTVTSPLPGNPDAWLAVGVRVCASGICTACPVASLCKSA